jgi:two-component system cell cycle response regulator
MQSVEIKAPIRSDIKPSSDDRAVKSTVTAIEFVCPDRALATIGGMAGQVLEILAGMTEELVGDGGVHHCLQTLTDAALRVLGADHASVRLRDDAGGLRVGARSGVGREQPAPEFDLGQGVLGWVAQHGQLARVSRSVADPRFQDRQERGYPVGSLMSIPIMVRGETRGVLTVSAAAEDAFDEAAEALGRLLAGVAAQTLHADELQRQAVTDSQTRAYNRRYLGPRLCEEIDRAGRRSEPLSVLLLDLDHFKAVNDQYGHGVGDQVLTSFADRVRACVRSVDVLVRRGGEEFVLVMPSTGCEEACHVAERIRRELARTPLSVRGGLALSQTVSIGVAVWDGQESAEALEERADQAMYEAKRCGRNRISEAPAPASQPPACPRVPG